jgi:hypothetical protein
MDVKYYIALGQGCIFCVKYEWAQQARVLHNRKLERFAMYKHTSLLGLLVNYKENEVLKRLQPPKKNFL